MARQKDGWIKTFANLIFKGLTGNEITYYLVGNLIADPKDSDSPGRLDISDRNMALLLEWHHQKTGRVRRSLLQKGFLVLNADGTYSINGYADIQSKDFPGKDFQGSEFPLYELLAYKRNKRCFRNTIGIPKDKVDDYHPLDTSGLPSSRVDDYHPLVDDYHPPAKLTPATKSIKDKKYKRRAFFEKTPDPRIKEILTAITEKAGYQIPNYAKEGQAVKRALQMGFTPEQFLECWQKMKTFAFWTGKWLPLAKVTENLGEFAAGRLTDGANRPGHQKATVAARVRGDRPPEDFRGKW